MYIIVTKKSAIDEEVPYMYAIADNSEIALPVMPIGRKVGRSIVGDKCKWSGD